MNNDRISIITALESLLVHLCNRSDMIIIIIEGKMSDRET